MNDKEKEFFKECLENPLMTPELLHIAIPKYSIEQYRKLQVNNKQEINIDKFKWNAIRHVIQFGMSRLGYEFSELMSCISINRYLMYEYLLNKKRINDWIRKRRGITKNGFRKLCTKHKKVGRKSRK